MSFEKSKNPILTIGLPVFNGENVIKKSIDSLLNQTFSDFELLISDNASTDSTQQLCLEYEKKDRRIRYIRQKTNQGPLKNFSFVLDQATSKYFMWAADDDLWEDTFLEKNISILELNPTVVGSISKVDFFGKTKSRVAKDPNFQPVESTSGTYEDRFSQYLKLAESTAVYAIYRTDCIKKSTFFHHLPWDLSIILAVLKFGDIHVVDETLFHRSLLGESSARIYPQFRNEFGLSRLEIALMFVPFIKWCVELFGKQFIFKNLKSFIHLHISGYGRLLFDEFLRIKK